MSALRIGFLIPTDFAIGNPGNGILAQARAQGHALQERGHEVRYLNPWEVCPVADLDVMQFFQGGPAMRGIERSFPLDSGTLRVMAPIIDSNHANLAYRLAVGLGRSLPRFETSPGLLADQADGSHLVICRSEHERQRVVRGLGQSPAKTALVLNGVAPTSSDPATLDEIRTRHQLPERFLLHVSAYTQPRKNVLALVRAATRLELPLVIAGHAEPGSVADRLASAVRGNPQLKVLGYVDRRTRDALYALCHVFCLPSLHEGTGLAALEAAAVGARVVITRNGGTRDYFGDHAWYVDPGSAGDLVAAIRSAWDAPPSAALRDHVRSSLTWDASAASLEQAYRAARQDLAGPAR
jgi:glycosyltransferase involved in cell wall biosynthesis